MRSWLELKRFVVIDVPEAEEPTENEVPPQLEAECEFNLAALKGRINFYAKTKKKSVLTNWPIVGMLPGLFLNRHGLHSFITEVLHNSDGTFVFKGPWFSNMEMVMTSDPANKGPSFKKIFDALGDGILASEFEMWENQRRIAMSLINHSQFQNFVVKTSSNIVENRLIPFLEHVAELGIQV
ncbi:Cytochrome [Forsythia ovata]|uniref:Cytochrome n=1 Tax=Forsythia ovata TaxID=205694 RepID=A0ABD1QCB8_9LAMI